MKPAIDYPPGATPLDRNELDGVKFRHVTTREELDELEQANIQSGLRWLARSRGDVLTVRFAVALHKRLFGDVWDWAGRFRKTGINNGVDPVHISVGLRRLMGDVRYWADHGVYDPIECAARLRQRIAFIHPFPKGNGRHARIMADIVLRRVFCAAPIDWAGGHDLQRMNDRRTAYIAALKAADAGDIAPLLAFVGRPKQSA